MTNFLAHQDLALCNINPGDVEWSEGVITPNQDFFNYYIKVVTSDDGNRKTFGKLKYIYRNPI